MNKKFHLLFTTLVSNKSFRQQAACLKNKSNLFFLSHQDYYYTYCFMWDRLSFRALAWQKNSFAPITYPKRSIKYIILLYKTQFLSGNNWIWQLAYKLKISILYEKRPVE